MNDKPIALESRAQDSDRLFSPSAARNRDVILAVLRAVLPGSGTLLEIASGTGEHVTHYAKALPDWRWRPSDLDAPSRRSIAAWTVHEGLGNVAPPIAIDASAEDWGVEADAPFDAMLCQNMIHIAPWRATIGLFKGAGRLLRPRGLFLLYGPFQENGVHNAPSNAAFDASLKARNPDWGVRDIADLQTLAKENGLALQSRQAMPANNQTLIFAKTA